MVAADAHITFPAKREFAILLRMAVSGAAAALDLPVDALEDLRTAADEALDYLLSEEHGDGARIECDMRRERDKVLLRLRFSGREGLPAAADTPFMTCAILQTLMNEVTLYADEAGGTGVDMALRLPV